MEVPIPTLLGRRGKRKRSQVIKCEAQTPAVNVAVSREEEIEETGKEEEKDIQLEEEEKTLLSDAKLNLL